MKYFKNKEDKIFGFELDGSQDYLITEDMLEITFEEVSELSALINQQKFNALSYSGKRSTEYPPVTDYIDGIVKGDQAQVQAYIDACLAVKAKYPKPSGQ